MTDDFQPFSYDQAIEMAKITSDFLWLASAMEGLVCATILLEYLQADIGHIVSRSPVSTPDPPTSTAEETSEASTSSPASESQGPRSTLTVVTDQYRAIIKNYQHTYLTANFSVPDLVYAEACLKMARLLSTAFLNQGWSDLTMGLLVQGKLSEHEEDELRKKKSESHMFLSANDMIRFKSSGIPRFRIAEWVTRIWRIHMNELALLDQVGHAYIYIEGISSADTCHRAVDLPYNSHVFGVLFHWISSKGGLAHARRRGQDAAPTDTAPSSGTIQRHWKTVCSTRQWRPGNTKTHMRDIRYRRAQCARRRRFRGHATRRSRVIFKADTLSVQGQHSAQGGKQVWMARAADQHSEAVYIRI